MARCIGRNRETPPAGVAAVSDDIIAQDAETPLVSAFRASVAAGTDPLDFLESLCRQDPLSPPDDSVRWADVRSIVEPRILKALGLEHDDGLPRDGEPMRLAILTDVMTRLTAIAGPTFAGDVFMSMDGLTLHAPVKFEECDWLRGFPPGFEVDAPLVGAKDSEGGGLTNELEIKGCRNLASLPDSLGPVDEVALIDLPLLKSIPASIMNGALKVRNCPSLERVDGHLRGRWVEFADCPALTTLPGMTIKDEVELARIGATSLPGDFHAETATLVVNGWDTWDGHILKGQNVARVQDAYAHVPFNGDDRRTSNFDEDLSGEDYARCDQARRDFVAAVGREDDPVDLVDALDDIAARHFREEDIPHYSDQKPHPIDPIFWSLASFKFLDHDGNLDLSGRKWLQRLPDDLTLHVAGDLNLSGCENLYEFPVGIDIEGDLIITGCDDLPRMPPTDMRIGGKVVFGDPAHPFIVSPEAYRALAVWFRPED